MSACDPPDRRLLPFPTPHGGCSCLAEEAKTYADNAARCLELARERLTDGDPEDAHNYVVHSEYHADGAIEAQKLCDYYATCIEHEAQKDLCEPAELQAMARERQQAEDAASRARVVKAQLEGLREQIERMRQAKVSVCHA